MAYGALSSNKLPLSFHITITTIIPKMSISMTCTVHWTHPAQNPPRNAQQIPIQYYAIPVKNSTISRVKPHMISYCVVLAGSEVNDIIIIFIITPFHSVLLFSSRSISIYNLLPFQEEFCVYMCSICRGRHQKSYSDIAITLRYVLEISHNASTLLQRYSDEATLYFCIIA